MGATVRAIDALNYATQMVKNMPLWRVQTELLNDVAKQMWRAAPWRWTLGDLPPKTLVNAQQDYAVTLPADFEYAVEANLQYADKLARDLAIVGFICIAGNKSGLPTQVAVTGATTSGNYRFTPTPSGFGTSNPAPDIVGIYKKQYVELDETSIYTAGGLIFPDVYFDVFKKGVLAYAYKFADDQRGGNAQFAGTQITLNGVMGEFEGALAEMRKREPLPLDDVRTAQDPKKEK